jgi:hypothetical protein
MGPIIPVGVYGFHEEHKQKPEGHEDEYITAAFGGGPVYDHDGAGFRRCCTGKVRPSNPSPPAAPTPPPSSSEARGEKKILLFWDL